MMEEITRNRAFSGDLRMLQPTRGLVKDSMASCPRCLCNSKWWTGLKRIPLSSFCLNPRNSKRNWGSLPPAFTQWSWGAGQQRLRCTIPSGQEQSRSELDHGALCQQGEQQGAVSKTWKHMATQNSIVYHCVFHIKKGVSVYTVFEDKPILAAGRLALYLGFWGAFVFVL